MNKYTNILKTILIKLELCIQMFQNEDFRCANPIVDYAKLCQDNPMTMRFIQNELIQKTTLLEHCQMAPSNFHCTYCGSDVCNQ
jgi:hypothetical protein